MDNIKVIKAMLKTADMATLEADLQLLAEIKEKIKDIQSMEPLFQNDVLGRYITYYCDGILKHLDSVSTSEEIDSLTEVESDE